MTRYVISIASLLLVMTLGFQGPAYANQQTPAASETASYLHLAQAKKRPKTVTVSDKSRSGCVAKLKQRLRKNTGVRITKLRQVGSGPNKQYMCSGY